MSKDATLYSGGVAVKTSALPSTVTTDNADTLAAQAVAALANNSQFLAIASPSNVQVLAQVQKLTRQINALIRIQTGQLDTTADT